MDSNPICHSSPAKKMKCLFLDYVKILMISCAGWWTWTPSATPLQPTKWNAHFWITFNVWWSARLFNKLEPHLPALSNQKKWNAHFWITFNFWWLPGLVDGLKHHLPPLSSQKIEMLIIGLCWTSDDWPGYSMDLNPIPQPSPANKMKCSFLHYIQLLMIGWADQWMARLVDGLKPYPPPLSSQQNEMLVFGLCSTSDDQAGWLMDSNPICHLFPATKLKCLFLDYVQILMIGWGNRWTWTPSATPLQPKNEMLILGLH